MEALGGIDANVGALAWWLTLTGGHTTPTLTAQFLCIAAVSHHKVDVEGRVDAIRPRWVDVLVDPVEELALCALSSSCSFFFFVVPRLLIIPFES